MRVKASSWLLFATGWSVMLAWVVAGVMACSGTAGCAATKEALREQGRNLAACSAEDRRAIVLATAEIVKHIAAVRAGGDAAAGMAAVLESMAVIESSWRACKAAVPPVQPAAVQLRARDSPATLVDELAELLVGAT